MKIGVRVANIMKTIYVIYTTACAEKKLTPAIIAVYLWVRKFGLGADAGVENGIYVSEKIIVY